MYLSVGGFGFNVHVRKLPKIIVEGSRQRDEKADLEPSDEDKQTEGDTPVDMAENSSLVSPMVEGVDGCEIG